MLGSTREAGHAYVVRLWFEPHEDHDDAALCGEYRGMVEHVATGDRRFFCDADALILFIFSFLQQPGP